MKISADNPSGSGFLPDFPRLFVASMAATRGLLIMMDQLHLQSSYQRFSSHSSRFAEAQQAPALDKVDKNNPVDQPQATEKAPPAKVFDVNEVVGNILNFVRQRIADQDPSTQEDMLAQARKGVEQGMAEATEVLDNLGMLDDTMVENITQAKEDVMASLASPEELMAPVNQELEEPEVAVSQRGVDLYQGNQQTFSLNIKTRDGDQVTIQYRNQSEQFGSLAQNGQGTSVLWASQESERFNLLVKGDLDEGELEAIENLLKDVDELAEEFYDGDLMTAFEMASELEIDMSELSSMRLRMREVDTVAARAYAKVDNLGAPQVYVPDDFGSHEPYVYVPDGFGQGQESETKPTTLEPLKQYVDHLLESLDNLDKSPLDQSAFRQLMDFHPKMDDRHIHLHNELMDQLQLV